MSCILHKGWLTKSPPENKLGSHIKLFRAKWKKRFFVLSLNEGAHDLSYYKDTTCQNKKGSVNLKSCVQVTCVEHSDYFANLFAVKTISKNKPRTYLLAGDTCQEVKTWIHWLHLICGTTNEETDDESMQYNAPQGIMGRSSGSLDALTIEYNASYDRDSPPTEEKSPNRSGSDVIDSSSTSTPVFADFIKYINDSLSFAEKGIIDLSTSETPTEKPGPGEASSSLDQTENQFSCSHTDSSSDDLPHSSPASESPEQQKGSRALSDYDIPRSICLKNDVQLPPPVCGKPKLVLHTYINTAPMSHLINPDIKLQP